MPDSKIVRAAIFPAVGISRLGASAEHFLSPEIYPEPPKPEGFYRDPKGALKRQAVRFRVYGLNQGGEAVGAATCTRSEC